MLKLEFSWGYATNKFDPRNVRGHLVRVAEVKALKLSAINCESFEPATPHFLSCTENLLKYPINWHILRLFQTKNISTSSRAMSSFQFPTRTEGLYVRTLICAEQVSLFSCCRSNQYGILSF